MWLVPSLQPTANHHNASLAETDPTPTPSLNICLSFLLRLACGVAMATESVVLTNIYQIQIDGRNKSRSQRTSLIDKYRTSRRKLFGTFVPSCISLPSVKEQRHELGTDSEPSFRRVRPRPRSYYLFQPAVDIRNRNPELSFPGDQGLSEDTQSATKSVGNPEPEPESDPEPESEAETEPATKTHAEPPHLQPECPKRKSLLKRTALQILSAITLSSIASTVPPSPTSTAFSTPSRFSWSSAPTSPISPISPVSPTFSPAAVFPLSPLAERPDPLANMLLLHQVGSVKIGEVVRYTVSYTPSHDRILPSPEFLHLRIRNSSAIALRAAFVHGPYTLSVAAYPASFNPNEKFTQAQTHGVPEFEPMVKAGGSWNCHLVVPDRIRQSAGTGGGHFGGYDVHGSDPLDDPESVSWVIEVSSQVIFSTSAAVGYEILLARDKKALNIGSGIPMSLTSSSSQAPQPGKLSDHPQSTSCSTTTEQSQPKGVFSRAIRMKVDDTASLWNTPRLPAWDDLSREKADEKDASFSPIETESPPVELKGSKSCQSTPNELKPSEEAKPRGPCMKKTTKKVHLIVLTHGLHSNLGSDMLFLKEAIDAGVKQAKIDAKARRARERAESKRKEKEESQEAEGDSGEETPRASSPISTPRPGDATEPDDDVDDDVEDEEVIVRGFSGNATRTERGIKYLGKRLAKFILSMTYPDQPYLPDGKTANDAVSQALKNDGGIACANQAHKKTPKHHHHHHRQPQCLPDRSRAYSITSISFVGHSLGGLVQTYAVAYIQKHSPTFFDIIRPINFIAMASPFLGLSNENPLYVKFALDFGLVGRTGQDLGLTWRAPTIARSGWGAIVSNLGESAQKKVLGEPQPESKPLLRILPTGPAHTALQKFRNRTVYSNVVNDGIVPLRTSCLLFLDWQGLGRVEKARREEGLVTTVVGFGWAELTGANVTSPRNGRWQPKVEEEDSSDNTPGSATPIGDDRAHDVPLPSSTAILDDDRASLRSFAMSPYQEQPPGSLPSGGDGGPFAGFFAFFQRDNGNSENTADNNNGISNAPKPPVSPRADKIYHRSQVLKQESSTNSSGGSVPCNSTGTSTPGTSNKSKVTTGHELHEEGSIDGLSAPPRTTFFESAGDLLNPKLPSVEYLIDPSKRPRTIFHDRVYHPSDIPPPPLKKRPASAIALRRRSITRTTSWGSAGANNPGMTSTASMSKTTSRGSSPFRTPRHENSWKDYYDPNATGGGDGSSHKSGSSGAPTGSPSSPPPPHPHPAVDPVITADIVDSANMKVEEKIARAYHRGLSWRKVLVKLEPDAHNNIMVRRMFANAYGWPVVHHMVEAHFSDSVVARTGDDEEEGVERAMDPEAPVDELGRETVDEGAEGDGEDTEKEGDGGDVEDTGGDGGIEMIKRTASEKREATDHVGALRKSSAGSISTFKLQEIPTPLVVGGAAGSPTTAVATVAATTIVVTSQSMASASTTQTSMSTQASLSTPALSTPASLSTPETSATSGSSSAGGLKPSSAGNRHRIDSVTWSERDWADSGDDSDDDMARIDSMVVGGLEGRSGGARAPPPGVRGVKVGQDATSASGGALGRVGAGLVVETGMGGSGGTGKDPAKRSSSPLNMLGLSSGSWNWTEKIVGRGGSGKSPTTRTHATLKKPRPQDREGGVRSRSGTETKDEEGSAIAVAPQQGDGGSGKDKETGKDKGEDENKDKDV